MLRQLMTTRRSVRPKIPHDISWLWNPYKAFKIPPWGVSNYTKRKFKYLQTHSKFCSLFLINTLLFNWKMNTHQVPIGPISSYCKREQTKSNQYVSNLSSSPHWYIQWILDAWWHCILHCHEYESDQMKLRNILSQ